MGKSMEKPHKEIMTVNEKEDLFKDIPNWLHKLADN